jgi:glycosyltransferase involved in cell wall biosynthesis
MKVLVLTRYSRLGASSRLRFLQFQPKLERQGFSFTTEPLLDDGYLTALYSNSTRPLRHIALSYLKRLRNAFSTKQYDLLWLEKEAFPWLPLMFERTITSWIPYVVDFDDAWFHRYDQSPNPIIRFMLGRKLNGIMKHAALVISANAYISERARQVKARQVLEVPTVVNLDNYAPRPPLLHRRERSLVVTWIGTPVTARYLELVIPVVRRLGSDVRLRLVGAGPLPIQDINIEYVPWSEANELAALQDSDVGIMPLTSGLWERGKSGFKLIQYMAASLPVIASPVGAARDIILPGVTGYLATNEDEWIEALHQLKASPDRARAMGQAGRERCASLYSIDAVLPRLSEGLKTAAHAGP